MWNEDAKVRQLCSPIRGIQDDMDKKGGRDKDKAKIIKDYGIIQGQDQVKPKEDTTKQPRRAFFFF